MDAVLAEVFGEVTLGERVARARLSLGARRGHHISQAELADMLGITGATMGNYEAGRTEPSYEILARIAKILGVPAGWLAFEEGGTPFEQNYIKGVPTDPTRRPARGGPQRRKK